jgi:hypothetical protein
VCVFLFACAYLLVGVCVRARICGTHMQPRTRSYVRSYVQLVRCSLFACAHLLVGVCVCASTHLWHAHAATHMQLNYILRAAGVCFLVCRLLLVCGCERTCTHICALTNLLMVSDWALYPCLCVVTFHTNPRGLSLTCAQSHGITPHMQPSNCSRKRSSSYMQRFTLKWDRNCEAATTQGSCRGAKIVHNSAWFTRFWLTHFSFFALPGGACAPSKVPTHVRSLVSQRRWASILAWFCWI